MFGLVASLLLSVTPTTASASVTCAEAPATCDATWVPALTAQKPAAEDDDGPSDYATPVEIECPAPPSVPMAADECDQTPPPDLWYRVSRFPGEEGAGSTLGPARRSRDGRASSSCGLAPPDAGRVLAPDAQPVALFALPAFVLSGGPAAEISHAQTLPARALAPPDRPPRV